MGAKDMRNLQDYIPLEQCVHRKLYRIHARNFKLGVFNAPTNGFKGIREKFGSRFIDEEIHWDADAAYGTVKPVEELPEILPEDIELVADTADNKRLFDWLEKYVNESCDPKP